MRRFRAWALCVFVVLLVSGCVSNDAKAATAMSSPAATAAAAAQPGSDTGSIAGVVVSDEAMPIKNAEVALVPGGNATKTDAAGQFTFNDIPGGSHTVLAAALGFEETSKRVTVVPGEIVDVRLVLKPVAVDSGPFVNVYPSRFFMVLDWGGFSSLLPQAEAVLCNPCNTFQHVQPAPVAVQIEMDWTKTIGAPYVADDHGLLLSSNPAANSSTSTTGIGTRVSNNVYSPRESYRLTEAEVGLLEETKKTVLRVYSGMTSVDVQQRVHSWMGMAYHGPLPEGFTMLPPP